MKKLVSLIGAAVVLLASSVSVGFGQSLSDDIHILTAGTDQPSGGYPGYPTIGHMSFFFSHDAQTFGLAPNAVKIQIGMPGGTHLDTVGLSLHHPGWSFTVTSPVSATLINTDTIPPFFFNGWVSDSFNIAFAVDSPITEQSMTIQASYTISGAFLYAYTTDQDEPTTMKLSVASTPLAVDFSSFVAEANGCRVDLTWTTASEDANAYFAIERSFDGRSFHAIGKVDAQNKGFHGERTYMFTDETPAKGANYYRIRQYDVNGRSSISRVAEVTMNCNINDISLYPNPTKGVIYLEGLVGANTIEVFNILGQQVLRKEGNATTEMLDISKLASGNYTIRILRNDATVFTAKVMKN